MSDNQQECDVAMKKVIYDTDIGIDDAMALLFLHYSPEVELRAIVSGFGNASVENTTRNALYMKDLFQIEAPVYQGAGRPYSVAPDSDYTGEYPDFVHAENGLGGIKILDPLSKKETKNGAQAIVDLVQDEPGEVSIVAVGRMTNLAHALELCPQLPQLVKELVVMGGAFGFNNHNGNVTPVAEANIWGDAPAAKRIFQAGFNISIVGLDVTEETIARPTFFEALRRDGGKAGAFIYAISRYYLNFHYQTRNRSECPVHDSSAVAYLLRPGYYTTVEARVDVVEFGPSKGQTVFDELRESRTRICTAVKAEEVLALYMETLTSGRAVLIAP